MSMMNLSILVGNLVRDPDLRYTPNGTAICEFTIANNKKWKNQAGDWQEKVNYVSCLCWGVRGEKVNEFFTKGKPIMVRGELEFQQWEDKEGNKRNALKINVQEWFFYGGKADSGAPAASAGSQEPSFPGAHNEVNEEEIPF